MDESLAAVFARQVGAAVAATDALEAELAAVVAVGRAAWPALTLASADFARHLAALYDGAAPVDDWLRERHAADLFLACACSHGQAEALAAFDRHCLSHVGKHLAPLRPDAAFVDEVRQLVREKLLVAVDGRPPRIAEYAGIGPLAGGWLRVVSSRIALDLKRRRSPSTAGADLADVAADSRAANPERGYVRGRYHALFQECLTNAVHALPAESRNLLRMHVVDGVRLEQLARLFRLSRATIVRRLAEARALVVTGIRTRVLAQLPLATDELDSLLGELVSQLDLSLATVL